MLERQDTRKTKLSGRDVRQGSSLNTEEGVLTIADRCHTGGEEPDSDRE